MTKKKAPLLTKWFQRRGPLIRAFPSWWVLRQWPVRFPRIIVATADDRNALKLSLEVFWAAILGAVATFNAAFALRLGATNSDIGLLSSLPALIAVLISIPAGRFLARSARQKSWILASLFVHRLGYLLIAAVPLLPSLFRDKGTVLVYLLIVMSAPAQFFGVGFNSMLADVVPERRRATVFATRNIIRTCVMSVATLLAGHWLERAAFPVNYQMLYLVGWVASMVSLYFLTGLQVSHSLAEPRAAQKHRALKVLWRDSVRVLRQERPFARLTVDTLLFNLPAWTVGPLYMLYFVRYLGASDWWIGLLGTVSNVGAIGGYALGQRVINRRGENWTLKRAAPGAGLLPILVGIWGSLTPILFFVGLDGLIAPSINLSHFTTLLKTCPEDRRPTFIGVFSTVMNIGAFVAPLLGVALADRLGPAPVLLACGGLRVLGGLMFTIWPVWGDWGGGQRHAASPD